MTAPSKQLTLYELPPEKFCPTCGAKIKTKKPRVRDLALLLWSVDQAIGFDRIPTEADLEQAREHCKMNPERLKKLRADSGYWHIWNRWLYRRELKLKYYQEHGEWPLPGQPLKSGDANYIAYSAIQKLYRRDYAAFKARWKKNPERERRRLIRRLAASRKLTASHPDKDKAIDDVYWRNIMAQLHQDGKLTFMQYVRIKNLCLMSDSYYKDQAKKRRARRKQRKQEGGSGQE